MIRLAVKEDISAIMDCINDARVLLKASGSTQWNGPLGYPNSSTFDEDIDNGNCFVCERDGIVCGVAVFESYEPEYDNPLAKWAVNTNEYTVIHRIATKKEYYGQGVAKELFNAAEIYSKALGRLSIRIDTHPKNVIVQHLVKSLGYIDCGSIEYSRIPLEPTRLIFEKVL